MAHTRGSPRLYASSARTKDSPSILSVFARRRRRDIAIEAGSTACCKMKGSKPTSSETERDALLSPSKDGTPAPGAMLKSLKGIGPEFAGVLWSEGLYRSFSNRRQVAAYAGLAPTPWQSRSVAHEQRVSKAGNPRLRTTMIQLAWLW